MKNKFVQLGLYVVVFLAFWNLFEYLYLTFITHSEYRFGVVSELLIPLVISVVMGCILFLRKKKEDDDV